MIPPKSSITDLPLISIAPVTNARHAWSALIMDAGENTDGASLVRVFEEAELGQALGSISCILPLPDPATLDDDQAQALPSEQIALLLPVEHCTDAAADDLQRLRSHGFRLMADGLPSDGEALSAVIHAVASEDMLPSAFARLPGPHLAMGVDTPSQFAEFQRSGFGWFAGDYPLHPVLGATKQDMSSRLLLLEILKMVAADSDTPKLEALLKRDPSLSYQLLKLVNSVSFSLTTKITSFAHAITILGRRQLQRWVQLLLYAQQRSDGTMNPLLARAALRASLMERLCQKIGGAKENQEQAFMTGMFSLLDVLFGMPLAQILSPLHLADEVEEALLARGGWLGGLLATVEQSERPPAPEFSERLKAVMLTPTSYCQALVQACQWAILVSREV